MPDQLLTIFRLCFLVLLYLFFFRVLRAIWTEISAVPEPVTAPAKEAKLSRKARKQLKNAEPVAPVVPQAAAFAPPQTDHVAAQQAPAPQPAGRPRALRAIDPPHLAGLTYPLSDGMTFGRASNCSVVLDDTFMSGTHLRIVEAPNGWYVDDLNSTNGTYLNRVRVSGAVELAIGDLLQIGNVVLEVIE